MSPPDPIFDDVFEEPKKGSPFFDDVFNAHAANPPPAVLPTPRPTKFHYGPMARFVDAMDLNMGPQYGAAIARLRGASPHDAAGIQAEIERARSEYEAKNPGRSLMLDLAGGTPLAVASLGLGGEGLSALAPDVSGVFNALRSGSWAGRRLGEGIAGALGGAALGALPNGETNAPLGERMARGAEVGGFGTPALGAALEPLLSRVPQLAAQGAQKLSALGVKLKAGDLPGVSPVLSWMNKIYGDGGAEGRASLTNAALRTVGAEGKPFTSATVRGVYGRLGDQFQHFADMASDVNLHDPQMRQGILGVLQDAAAPGSGISEEGFQKLQSQARTILGSSEAPNPITGKTYLQLTRSGTPLDRLSRDPEVGDYASRMWDTLNDSLERHVASGLGKWVPSSSGAAAAPSNAGALYSQLEGPAAARQLEWGQGRDSGGRYASGRVPLLPDGTRTGFTLGEGPVADQVEGTLENGTPHPLEPGMEWQYSPGAEGLLDLLRTTRSQWRNMKVLEPLVDDTTGEISDPRKLASRVDRAFGNSPKSQLMPDSQDLVSLGQADNFIPPAKGSAPEPPSIWSKLAGKAAIPGALLLGAEGVPLMHELATDWKPILMGGAAAGAAGLMGKGANVLAQGPLNTARILDRAAAGEAPSVLPWAQLLGGPAISLTSPSSGGPSQ